jgi:uncharacterized RDD family membrane protein YckC
MTELLEELAIEKAMVTDQQGWITEPVAPWRRYGARALDIIVNGGIGFTLFGFGFGLIAPQSAEQFFSIFEGPAGRFIDLFVTILAAGFFNAIVMGTTGSTLGKAIFGIKVLMPDQARLGFLACLARETKVWVFGMGLGLPFVSLFTMIMGYNTVAHKKEASWDKGQYVVFYRPSGNTQTALNVLGIALIVAGRAVFAYLATL